MSVLPTVMGNVMVSNLAPSEHRQVKITLDVPQVRNSETPFQPLIPGFEQGKRVDRALNLAIAEMYLQGVSTRKVAKVMQEICGGNGVIADCAVFVAVGIEAETGRRIVLGVSVGLSEAAEH